jgi:hypothetical protein
VRVNASLVRLDAFSLLCAAAGHASSGPNNMQ